ARDLENTWFDRVVLGTVWLAPKAVRSSHSPATGVHYVGAQQSTAMSDLDVRVVVTPTVDFHVVEILFLWQFGPVLDRLLGPSSVGYRLKRPDADRFRQHIFEFWPATYHAFRADAMNAARTLLRDRRVGSCLI